MHIIDPELKLDLLEMWIGPIQKLGIDHGLNKGDQWKPLWLHQNPYMSHVCFSLHWVGSFQLRYVVSHALTANLKSI